MVQNCFPKFPSSTHGSSWAALTPWFCVNPPSSIVSCPTDTDVQVPDSPQQTSYFMASSMANRLGFWSLLMVILYTISSGSLQGCIKWPSLCSNTILRAVHVSFWHRQNPALQVLAAQTTKGTNYKQVCWLWVSELPWSCLWYRGSDWCLWSCAVRDEPERIFRSAAINA